MSQPRSLQSLFADRGAGLERLLDRAHALAEMDRRLRRLLPPSVADHLLVANVRDGVLFLQAPSAEWRSRAHFFKPQIVEALRGSFPNLTDVRVRVAPKGSEPKAAPRTTPRRSAAAAHLLQATAECIGDDALRQALTRLAARHRAKEGT